MYTDHRDPDPDIPSYEYLASPIFPTGYWTCVILVIVGYALYLGGLPILGTWLIIGAGAWGTLLCIFG